MTPATHRRGLRRVARVISAFFALSCSLFAGLGCQQKMAEQPYHRPLEPSAFFADGRSSRPLEPGVIHRGQHLDWDPMVTGLTVEEWGRFWRRGDASRGGRDTGNTGKGNGKGDGKGGGGDAKADPKTDPNRPAPDEDREQAIGAPRYDPPGFKPSRPGATPHPGPQVYVNEFPFEITGADLSRGADRYTIFCAVCHGPMGNGKGKVWERGYLKPTSYHTEKVEDHEPGETGLIPLGYSRGYWRWGIEIPVRDVPVGYVFEVITKGYGAMPDHAAQIPPKDRWRIIAYVRTLQWSRRADAKDTAGGKTP